MREKIFSGACTALITPMKNGKIDYKNLDRLIDHQIESGISALVIAGTTGESATLSYKEHRELIRHAIKRADGKTKIIAGTGSNDTEKAVRMSKYSEELGADALLVVTPYYNKSNQKGIIKHYETITGSVRCPVIVYNVPTRTCVNITPDTYKKLSEQKNICGIKEASTDMSAVACTINSCKLPLYSGNDDLLFPILSIGGEGIISVMSNIFPDVTVNICKLFAEGKRDDALYLYMKYLKFAKLLFSDVNPIPIKAVMAYAGLCENELRLPLVPADARITKKVITENKKLTNTKLF